MEGSKGGEVGNLVEKARVGYEFNRQSWGVKGRSDDGVLIER